MLSGNQFVVCSAVAAMFCLFTEFVLGVCVLGVIQRYYYKQCCSSLC